MLSAPDIETLAVDAGRRLSRVEACCGRQSIEVNEIHVGEGRCLQRILHIVDLLKRLWHVRCSVTGEERWDMKRHDCWGLEVSKIGRSSAAHSYYEPKEGAVNSHGNLLPLLMTCRHVYTEAINILYSENVFDFKHLYTIFDLSSTIPSHRFNSIRSIQLAWHFEVPIASRDVPQPHDPATWKKAWQLLASMKGLRLLRVDLRGSFHWHMQPRMDVLMPLCEVKQTEAFEVNVPFDPEDIDEIASAMENAPFVLKGPNGQTVTHLPRFPGIYPQVV
ncbi:MAG: hypothetical protein M1837_005726 [Sclerophora amabilis]|nr:MAG: hypothetical protein M1837_005726 [Sclerophora amabilis]